MAIDRDDSALRHEFTTATLPRDAWTHAAHVRVAFLHRRRWALDEAHLRMRVGIIRLNAFHGLVETAERGYHETITRAWLAVVGGFIARSPDVDDSRAFLEAHAAALGTDALFRHYTKELLLGLAARARFVPPDREPLPG